MPIDFSSLPAHIQVQVTEKLRMDDAAVLEMTSKASKTAIQRVRTPFAPMTVASARIYERDEEVYVKLSGKKKMCSISNDFQLRFKATVVDIKDDFSEPFCTDLLKFVRRSGSTFSTLVVSIGMFCWAPCSSSSFHKLLEAAQVKNLNFLGAFPMDYIQNLPEKVKHVSIKAIVRNEDLANIKAADIKISYSEIGNSALNAVLKEWLHKNRSIENMTITTDQRLTKEEILDGISFLTTHDDRIFKLDNGTDELYVLIDDRGERRFFQAASSISESSHIF